MESLRIKNLRSLEDTGDIQIKKINVLVGNNSSGKSTFVRFFPLLKQSFNKKLTGPILWAGDENDYVDFGSFNESVFCNDDKRAICFSFSGHVNFSFIRSLRPRTAYKAMEARVSYYIVHGQKNDYVEVMELELQNRSLKLELNEAEQITKAFLNDKEIDIEEKSNGEELYDYYFPQILFDIDFSKLRRSAFSKLSKLSTIKEYEIKSGYEMETLADEYFISEVFKLKNRKTSNKIATEIVEKLHKEYESEFLEELFFSYIAELLYSDISRQIKIFFSNIHYIAPVRASAERYYRIRNYAVDEVDSRGKNLSTFINSLSENERDDFKVWMEENLGFSVGIQSNLGHASIEVQKAGQEGIYNLSDTGFGYSQILPIVTQIWYTYYIQKKRENISNDNSFKARLIVIEQPELHLHPALQAKLIDVMIKTANECNIKFIIETHSESIINRIGKCIEDEQISHEDVGINVFEKKLGDNKTTIRSGGYNQDGYLENWPLGFFEPD